MDKPRRFKFKPVSCLPRLVRKRIQVQNPEQPEQSCWLWTGFTNPKQGPITAYGGAQRSARRVVFELLTEYPLAASEILNRGKCDIHCVNPHHAKFQHQRNSTPETTPEFSQARHICAKFGGEIALAKLLGINQSTCYRWSYPSPQGTNGIVPNRYVTKIKSLARFHGVLLTDADWAPNRMTPIYETED